MKPNSRIAAASLTLLLIARAGYIGAHFHLQTDRRHSTYGLRGHTAVIFRHEWQANLFKPAATVEGILTGRDVQALRPSRHYIYDVF